MTSPHQSKETNFGRVVKASFLTLQIPSSSDKGVNKSIGILSLYSDTSKPPISLKGASITSVAFSSNKINANQEPHRKRLKKKHKDSSNEHCEFADLDFISIDTVIFEYGIAGSTMSLADFFTSELEKGIDMILKGLQKTNVIELSPLQSQDGKASGELQKSLARAEKELEAWTSKKKKTISLIEEHQKKLSRNQ
ncbi:hypothetical protein FXO38_05119 [Capsicum annuum]|nr:hypothetical protein FXO38_05119 [Capsicum annuum]